MIEKNFNRKLISHFFQKSIDSWPDFPELVNYRYRILEIGSIKIPDDQYSSIKKFAKKYGIEEVYYSDLAGIYWGCRLLFNYGDMMDKKMEISMEAVNLYYDIRAVLEGGIKEVILIGNKKRVRFSEEFYTSIVQASLNKKFEDKVESKLQFVKSSYKRVEQLKAGLILQIIFTKYIKTNAKSKNQLYTQIYDFLLLAGFFSGTNLSTKAELVKKLFQKKDR